MGAHAAAKIATSGLIFHCDLGSDRSYTGAPVTNNQWNSGSEFAPWKANGSGTPNIDVTGTAEAGPIKTAKTWKFIKDGTSSQWNGWEGSYGAIWTGSSGDIWTTSYWYKTSNPAGHANFTVGYFYLPDWSRAFNYTILSSRDTIIADGTWRYNYTVTRLNENYSNAIIVDGPSWNYSTSPGVLYINGLQWNKNSFATKFTKGTRTSSQSVVNLANTTIIDGNLSYAYDGTPYFNGPTSFDYLYATESYSHRGTNSFTYEAWFNHIDDNGYDKIIIGKPGGHTGLMAWGGQRGLRLLNSAGNGWYDIFVSDSYNTWVHLVGTYEYGVGSKLYINGVLVGSNNFSDSLYDRGSTLHIGGNVGWNANYSHRAYIDITRVYNRALSANEVATNFAAQRSRFGI
jgi:hypothetical protein